MVSSSWGFSLPLWAVGKGKAGTMLPTKKGPHTDHMALSLPSPLLTSGQSESGLHPLLLIRHCQTQ